MSSILAFYSVLVGKPSRGDECRSTKILYIPNILFLYGFLLCVPYPCTLMVASILWGAHPDLHGIILRNSRVRRRLRPNAKSRILLLALDTFYYHQIVNVIFRFSFIIVGIKHNCFKSMLLPFRVIITSIYHYVP